MNTITIHGESFVKAADLARDLGYTADYVGQLCRSGKVDAQLVGRSWYVSEDSIREHKQNRYRGTKAADSKTIKKTLQTKDLDAQDTFKVSINTEHESKPSNSYSDKNFYTRSTKAKEANYFDDDHALIPKSSMIKNKTGRLSVTLGDALNVKIKSKSKEYDFTPSERPAILFTGKLSISEAEEDEVEVVEEVEVPEVIQNVPNKLSVSPEITEDEPVAEEVEEHVTKVKIKHVRPSTKKPVKKLPLEHNADGIVGMRRERIVDRNPIGGTLKVAIPDSREVVTGSMGYVIAISTFCSLALLISMLGLQSTVAVEDGILSTSYVFLVDTLLAAVSLSL
ncbi:MAG: hypothetical protein ACI9H6_000485 [Patiriisocius sp.]|jgi:hypothetical protein